jgi:peptide deformylase
MRVKVHAQDRHGRPFDLEGEGLLARAICHELDHLDGRLYIDVMDRELTEEEIKGHIPEDDVQ